MSIPARRLWSLVSLCGALLAAAPAAAGPHPWIEVASDPRPPFDLVAPAPGAVLDAGAMVELAWVARPGFDRLAGIDEWEAFLSLDGGASYPIRITPHLDRDLRRVLWRVPALPTRDARLMLRFGDEGRETAYPLPHRFVIAGDTPPTQATPPGVALGRGEPALPGAPGVVLWVEGARRGGATRTVTATTPAAWHDKVSPLTFHPETAEVTEDSSSGGPPALGTTSATRPPLPPRNPSALAGAGQARRHLDILLLTQRQNE